MGVACSAWVHLDMFNFVTHKDCSSIQKSKIQLLFEKSNLSFDEPKRIRWYSWYGTDLPMDSSHYRFTSPLLVVDDYRAIDNGSPAGLYISLGHVTETNQYSPDFHALVMQTIRRLTAIDPKATIYTMLLERSEETFQGMGFERVLNHNLPDFTGYVLMFYSPVPIS